MSYQVERKRNWAVYILFFVTVVAGILAFVDAGRYMGWIPVNATIPGLGEISFMNPNASWFAALMSALLGAIWFLVAYWLWTLNPSGWMFVIVISVINLIFLALAVLGRTTFSQVLPAVVINGLAMIMALLPSTRDAFMPRQAMAEDAQAEKGTMAAAAASAVAVESVSRTPEAPAAEADKMDAAEFEAAIEAAETDAPLVEAAAAAPAMPPREDAPQPKPEPVEIDLELTMVEGIGPKIAAALEEAGINSLYKLAAVSEEELRNILRDAGLSADPTTWPKQGQLAAAGDFVSLKVYQDSLVGGREA